MTKQQDNRPLSGPLKLWPSNLIKLHPETADDRLSMAQVMKAVALTLLKSGSARINMAQGMWASVIQ